MTDTPVFSHTQHKRMWEWLAQHPECNIAEFLIGSNQVTKEEKDVLFVNNMLYPCMYANIIWKKENPDYVSWRNYKLEDTRCDKCPLPRRIDKMYNCGMCLDGHKKVWIDLGNIRRQILLVCHYRTAPELRVMLDTCNQQISDVCLKIANLPVCEGVPTE